MVFYIIRDGYARAHTTVSFTFDHKTHTHLWSDGCGRFPLTALPFSVPLSAGQVVPSFGSGLQKARRTSPPANEEQPSS